MNFNKWCFIPGCTNTSKNSSEKVFISVPHNISRKKKWFAAARRQLQDVSIKTTFYCCEDHFNIKEDMENYLEYRLSKVRARMKPEVVPHIFTCKPDKQIKNAHLSSEKRARKRISELSKESEGPMQKEEIIEDPQPSTSFYSVEDVKAEHEDQATSAFMENRIASSTVIKTEPNWENEIEQDKAEPQLIVLLEGLKAMKTERILDVSNDYDFDGSKELFSRELEVSVKSENNSIKSEIEKWPEVDIGDLDKEVDLKVEGFLDYEVRSKDLGTQELEISLKTENSETKSEIENRPEVVYDDWIIKNEDLDIKGEDLFETNVSSGLCIEEKCDEYKKHNRHVSNFQTERKNSEKEHLLLPENPSGVNLFRCNECEYQTHKKLNLTRHLVKHKNSAEVNLFKCDKCEYKTRHKHHLKAHSLRHKNVEEINLFRCDKCEYQTGYKHNLKAHSLRHKTVEEVDLFRCDKCEYQTRYKRNFKTHSLRHKNPEEVDLLRCDKCDYQTFIKRNLTVHLSKHKNPEKVDLFRCDKCEYQTHYKTNIRRHSFRHKNPEEVDLFKCDKCKFQTFYKHHFKEHTLRHINPEEEDLFRCDKCEYQTHFKNYLRRHSFRHKNPEVDLFKCDKCEYQTFYKHHFKEHSLRHINPEEADLFSCDKCKYQTHIKNNLRRHSFRHKKPEESF